MKREVEPWARVWVEEMAKAPPRVEVIHVLGVAAFVGAVLVVVAGVFL